MARYAVNASNVVAAAERWAAVTRAAFVRRRSDYWGEYCLFRALLDRADVHVYANCDPMYRPDLDPPEERFFEAGIGAGRVLIDDGEPEHDPRVEEVVRRAFPDAIRLGGAAGD